MEGTEWPIQKIKCKHRTKATATRMYTFLCQEMFHLRTITAFIANVWPNLDVPRGHKYYLDRQDINKLLSFLPTPFPFQLSKKNNKRRTSIFLLLPIYIYLSILKGKYFLRRIIRSRCYERSEDKAKQTSVDPKCR